YLKCKTKAHLKALGEQGVHSEYELFLAEMKSETRTAMIEWGGLRHGGGVGQDVSVEITGLGRGTGFILGGTLRDDTFCLPFDGLKKVPGESGLGAFHYIPVLFHEGERVRLEARLLLAILGVVLGDLQGRQPETGVVYYGPECRGMRIKLSGRLRERGRLILQ